MGLACAVLLSHGRRALAEDTVTSRAEFLHQVALDSGARTPAWQAQANGNGLPPPSLRASGLLERALGALASDGAVKMQEAGGQRFYSVLEDRRMQLDYHKNSILHFLLAPAILALALRSFQGQPAPLMELLRRAKDASRLLKHEFIYEPGRLFENTVDETFQQLVRWGLAEKREVEMDLLIVQTPAGANSLRLLAELLRPFAEGVWLCADALSLLLAAPLEPKEWTQRALDRGRAAYLAGRIERAESLSKATLENAVLMYRDRGVLAPAEGKGAKMVLAPEWKSEEKLQQLVGEVDRLLS
jgi:glycerol-3-phosphate O-acyltransferase